MLGTLQSAVAVSQRPNGRQLGQEQRFEIERRHGASS
jgi:hypothetical protein